MNRLLQYFIKGILPTALLFVFVNVGYSQQSRELFLDAKITSIAADIPGINELVDISVSDVPLQEFVRGIASNAGLNINVDPNVKVRITANYSKVKVSDILIFLCKEYSLDISTTGNIISLAPYLEPVKEKPQPKLREIKVEYDQESNLLTVDLMNDTLYRVVRKLTDLSKKNVIIAPELNNVLISGYIKSMPFDVAMERLMFTNKLSCSATKDNFYLIDRADVAKASGEKKVSENTPDLFDRNYAFSMHTPTTFSLQCSGASLDELVRKVSDTLSIGYSVVDKLEGKVDLNLVNVSYDDFLRRAFAGSVYSFSMLESVYVVGKSDNAMLKTARMVRLQHRTVDKLIDVIPEMFSTKLIIKEFADQNSFIVSGDPLVIDRFQSFIKEVDQVVPLVLIELLIVEVNKSRSVSVGLNLGVKTPTAGKQTLSPGVDYNVSPNDLNNVIDRINSFGWINLGKVSPNFFMNIQALEDDGKIVIRSTPKLATLNGHEATMSSGEKKYYKEERSNVFGSQNPSYEKSYTWTAIEAKLAVTIRPIVSGNEQITLEITVDQSQFTPREFEGAPPGSVNRTFKSQIRMKNQEMVLLGGLDKFNTNNTSKGLPLLARIPVLKWIFGSNSRSKNDSKLSLFIQPTIIF